MRDALIVGFLCIVAIVAGGWVFVHGSPFGMAEPSTPGPVAFSVLAEGTNASISEKPVNYRITEAEEFAAMWDMLGRSDVIPRVDFKKQEVLAVFDGERATSGYTIGVQQVTNTEDTRIVEIAHTVPGEGCITAQSVTYPYVLIVVPKTTLSLTHTRTTTASVCQ